MFKWLTEVGSVRGLLWTLSYQLTNMRILMIKIRQSHHRLIGIMEIPITAKQCLYWNNSNVVVICVPRLRNEHCYWSSCIQLKFDQRFHQLTHFEQPLMNALWLSNTSWIHRSGSTLAQVMVCCLTAATHCLDECWLTISKFQRHSS